MIKLVLLLTCSNCFLFANAQLINLNKQIYKPGEKIIVHFSKAPDLPGDIWLGTLPTSIEHGSAVVNDKHDISCQYLKNGTQGTLVFTAPKKEKKYDFRLNDSDNKGREIAHTYFEVSSTRENISSGNKANYKIAGIYSTALKKMELTISGNPPGTFKHAGGRVDGTLPGHTLTGTWRQNNGKRKMILVFNSHFSAFPGKWS